MKNGYYNSQIQDYTDSMIGVHVCLDLHIGVARSSGKRLVSFDKGVKLLKEGVHGGPDIDNAIGDHFLEDTGNPLNALAHLCTIGAINSTAKGVKSVCSDGCGSTLSGVVDA